MILQTQDKTILKQRGITEEKLTEQLNRLRNGFPYLKIEAAAIPGNGILVTDARQRAEYINKWNEFVKGGAKVVKMVPASGAASRMFKELFKFAESAVDTRPNEFIKEFADNIEKFAFYSQLLDTCITLYGKDVLTLIGEGRIQDVVKALILPVGMNYGQLPKALLSFHRTDEGIRTALEEHLAEGAQYAAGSDKTVHVHFTLSPSHIPLVDELLAQVTPGLEKRYGVTLDITKSIQKPSTDTPALGPDMEIYRKDGEIFFRPGGHGALIENLQAIDADAIFLKNIDNVVPDSKRDLTVEYKKVIGGVLVDTSERIRYYISELEGGLPSRPVLNEMLDFLHERLFITHEGAEHMDDLELADYILCKLQRPVRVCGMVRNEGEPGGGPFLVYGPDGTVAPQILESTQINPDSPEQMQMLKQATHFNPVDLVCAIRKDENENFDLQEFVDPETGFISSKSVEGVEIKALELPGLWNGAMSDWNTIFVEVPARTFNPVKTVNDLLRPMHRG